MNDNSLILRWKGRFTPIILLILSITACAHATGPAGPGLELRTDRASYTSGDGGLLTLTNLHATAIILVVSGPSGICSLATLQQRSASGWEDQNFGCVQLAILGQRKLAGGATITERFNTGGSAFQPGGEYRFAVVTEDSDMGREVQYSNAFTIEE